MLSACMTGDTSSVKDLISKGIDLNGVTPITPLMSAIKNNHKKIVELLIDNGANLELKDEKGQTALCHAIRTKNNILTQLLICRGADINSKCLYSGSFLTTALRLNCTNIAEMLINYKIDIEVIDCDGYTALNLAAFFGDEFVVELLLKNNAKIDTQDNNGMTAIMNAFTNCRREISFSLLEKSPNLELRNNDNKNILDIAINNKDFMSDILQKHDLLSSEQGNELLIKACQTKNEANILYLHERGMDFHVKNDKGESAYQILKRKRSMGPELQALKEKLVLSTLNEEVEELGNSL